MSKHAAQVVKVLTHLENCPSWSAVRNYTLFHCIWARTGTQGVTLCLSSEIAVLSQGPQSYQGMSCDWMLVLILTPVFLLLILLSMNYSAGAIFKTVNACHFKWEIYDKLFLSCMVCVMAKQRNLSIKMIQSFTYWAALSICILSQAKALRHSSASLLSQLLGGWGRKMAILKLTWTT